MNDWLPFEWIAAVRFLREGRLQSIFIIVGAAIGVAVIVFMSALLDGLQSNLFKRVLSSQPHIVLQRPQQVAQPQRTDADGTQVLMAQQKPSQRISSIDQWQKVRAEMQLRPDVLAVSPSVTGPAFVLRGDASQSISLIGIDPEQYARIVPLPEKITAGSYRMTNTDMLIGIQLAEDMGVQVGDKLRVTSANGGNLTLTIAGLFDLGNRAVNQRNVYVLLSTAQNLTGLVGGVSTIDLTVKMPFDAELVAQSISAATGLQALSWIATNNQFFLGLNAQKFSSQMIRLFVGLSVAAGIASVLVVSVVQRSKEIGILRAMGGSRGQIMRLFLIQGGIVGLLGSVLGSAMASGLLLLWRLVAKNPDGTPMFVITVSGQLVLWAALLATLTGLAAAVTPALRAARLQPVEAIRG
ncbi:ABC transporter permease [Actimicrobium sp. CCI2.3]|uniref:ABC transporter permease n=1 Tax=Actimicrobium sp. CCI2.3 TaxID=3048616 RepID=UPI002AB58DE9|nr:FtsX-like permease family protein [Actimicrobium sp. CCI2.3]MDY7575473.1 FtsX-like permease family protein [Actimicrobium sp. CCI2.3]MEB0024038.1 ABC transporter permease [Actimicrobium sp. CCI2.3]